MEVLPSYFFAIFKSSRQQAMTMTCSLRDREESWNIRDRDSQNGSRDSSRDRDQVSRLHHHCL